MHSKEWETVLEIIAKNNCTMPQKVREEIRFAIDTARANPTCDSAKLWNSIPKKGTEVTVEEFLDYLLSQAAMHDS